MTERTGDTSTSTEPRFGYCHWHKGPSGTAVLVQIIEQGSGPGAGLYACAPCREQRHLVPVAEPEPVEPSEAAYRLYIDHTVVCPDCGRTCESCGRGGRCEGGARLWKAYLAVRD